jgi:hypothetical protein
MRIKLLLLLFTSIGFNANQARQSPSKYNSVESANIIIVNKLQKWPAWGTAQALQKAFGKAKIKKEPDEVLGGFGYTYSYRGLEVYFHAHNCESVTITGPAYQVLLNGQAYKPGDSINKLKAQFSNSYKAKADGGIHLNIIHKKAFMDAYLSITYNTKGIITNIEIANDNS